MKKIVILLSVTALFMTACEKEETKPIAANDVVLKEKSETNDKVGPIYIPENYRLFFNEVRYPTGCVPFKGSCFPEDIVITAGMTTNVNDLFDAIENGEQSAIQVQFLNQSDFLIDLLSKEMSVNMAQIIIEEVMNGGLTVNAIYNTLSKDGNTNRFLRFVSNESQKQVLVLPFANS
ncbi:MAG: hypothetical protein JKY48_05705 [Flavobacteriales bacterium]|nr:hypothetical protein [Flavobacteriales bacterium]